jgi:hypothetical protein
MVKHIYYLDMSLRGGTTKQTRRGALALMPDEEVAALSLAMTGFKNTKNISIIANLFSTLCYVGQAVYHAYRPRFVLRIGGAAV